MATLPDMTLAALSAAYAAGGLRPSQVVDAILARIATQTGDNVWINRVPEAALRARAGELDRLQGAGKAASLPLFGIPFAIKDNIDLADVPTTAACPDFAYVPKRSAAAVERLEAAGAIAVGKTNLDQFATGLVGVRSPYGTPRNPFAADYIPGGSSSGSAVAVAGGAVSFALGTDTAGSGRVPAGFNNIVGIKPSLGLVSTRGVVPACRSLDCVSVFALTVADGMSVLAVMAGTDAEDPYSRTASHGLQPLAPAQDFDFAIPADPTFFGDSDYERLFGEAIARLQSLGGRLRAIDFAPFAAAAEILYSDAGVAERVAAVGDFLRDHPRSVLPVTRDIIERGRKASAADVYRAREKLAALRARAMASLDDTRLLVVPTAPTIYRVAEVERDPVALNSRLGTYTNFVNPMDLSAISVPSGFTQRGLPFGITLIARAFEEVPLAAVASAFERAAALPLGAAGIDQTTASAVSPTRPAT
ncbi:MAG TPA: allophanate hydrolase [Stellaceae bacterium]|nr:allophanate hydrolase [Stellaceae bacterium]